MSSAEGFTEQDIDAAGQEHNWDSDSLYRAEEGARVKGDGRQADLYACARRRAIELEKFNEWWNSWNPE